jgi:hypothetical protein
MPWASEGAAAWGALGCLRPDITLLSKHQYDVSMLTRFFFEDLQPIVVNTSYCRCMHERAVVMATTSPTQDDDHVTCLPDENGKFARTNLRSLGLKHASLLLTARALDNFFCSPMTRADSEHVLDPAPRVEALKYEDRWRSIGQGDGTEGVCTCVPHSVLV